MTDLARADRLANDLRLLSGAQGSIAADTVEALAAALQAAHAVIRRRDDDWYPSDDLTVWWRIDTTGREYTEPMTSAEADVLREARSDR
jgi:hypothetical protein